MNRLKSSLRLSLGDCITIGIFTAAIAVANVIGESPLAVWLLTLVAPVVLGTRQIRQANVSEAAIRQRLESDLSTRNRELCEANISETLRQAARIMATQNGKVRANLMLIGEDQKLFVAYHHNMAKAADHGIRLDRYHGCAGHAWALADQAFADLGDVTQDELKRTWKLTAEQVARTASIKSMICTPVRDPRSEEVIIGVVSVDSALSLFESGLAADETSEEGVRVAKSIGRLLVIGGIIWLSGRVSMVIEYEDIAPGLKIRKNTPKQVQLTQDFVRKLTEGSDSKVFKDQIEELARADASE